MHEYQIAFGEPFSIYELLLVELMNGYVRPMLIKPPLDGYNLGMIANIAQVRMRSSYV